MDNENNESECKVCEKKFKSIIPSQDHDRKFHLTLGPGNKVSYKCDYYKALKKTREQLFEPIFCQSFPNIKLFWKSFKKKTEPTSRHTIEKEPILEN